LPRRIRWRLRSRRFGSGRLPVAVCALAGTRDDRTLARTRRHASFGRCRRRRSWFGFGRRLLVVDDLDVESHHLAVGVGLGL